MPILVKNVMFMKMRKKEKGFSIGEVMVAMFILLVGIVDAIFLTVRSVEGLHDSRDAVIATLLAQEGVELVRNVRDNNVTQDCPGDQRCTAFDEQYGFLSVTGAPISWCTIDYDTDTDDSHLDCSGASRDDRLYLNNERELYDHGGGSGTYLDTELRRRIYVEYDTSDNLPLNASTPVDQITANVTSVVVFGEADFPDSGNIETECMIARGCVYAQTRLTSWINYGE